jgi:hypothetical protein
LERWNNRTLILWNLKNGTFFVLHYFIIPLMELFLSSLQGVLPRLFINKLSGHLKYLILKPVNGYNSFYNSLQFIDFILYLSRATVRNPKSTHKLPWRAVLDILKKPAGMA